MIRIMPPLTDPTKGGLLKFGSLYVPWNASWSAEGRNEIRPCRWANGQLAVLSPHKPGEGRPLFAKPHHVRQRQSIAAMICTVCGKHMPVRDRWWFGLGDQKQHPSYGDWVMTTESPVHEVCADLALEMCPHLRGHKSAKSPMPGGYQILTAIVGGDEFERDFGVKTNGRTIVGHLKLAWPISLLDRTTCHGPPGRT